MPSLGLDAKVNENIYLVLDVAGQCIPFIARELLQCVMGLIVHIGNFFENFQSFFIGHIILKKRPQEILKGFPAAPHHIFLFDGLTTVRPSESSDSDYRDT